MREHDYDYPIDILNQQYNTNWMERPPIGAGIGAGLGAGLGAEAGLGAGVLMLPPTGVWHPHHTWLYHTWPYQTWHPTVGWTYWF